MAAHDQTIVLRKATAADASDVASIHLGARRRYQAYAPMAHSEAEVRAWVRDRVIPSNQTWVLDLDGEIVAYLTWEIRPDGGWIDQLHTHPDATGRGYGGTLLALAKRELPSPIRLYTFQQNFGARRFYERAGFVVEQLSDGQNNEEQCPDVLYRWPA